MKIHRRRCTSGKLIDVFLLIFAAASILFVIVTKSRPSKIKWVWINLDENDARRQHMVKQLSNIPNFDTQRMPAYNKRKIKRMVDEGHLRTNKFTFGFDQRRPVCQRHRDAHYTYAEGGCTVSHIEAIKIIANGNHDYGVVSEDDASIPDDFSYRFEKIITTAPPDWQVLQLHTNNEDQNEHNKHIDIDWIHWFPHHWGTLAYVIRKSAAKKMIEMVFSEGTSQTMVMPFKKVLVADEFVYWNFTTYTYTGNILDRVDFGSNIQPESTFHLRRSKIIRNIHTEKYEPLDETLFILTQYLVKQASSFWPILNRINIEYNTMKTFYRIPPKWTIIIVAKTPSIIAKLKENIRGHDIHFVFKIEKDVFSKWKHFIPILIKANDFSRVLIKDGDQSLIGFPWLPFIKKSGTSVIASPIREAVEESLIREVLIHHKRQWFQVNDARWWRNRKQDHFLHAQTLERPFLEMYFVVFDGLFSTWFFRKLNEFESVKSLESSWGPDYAWCGAAYDWNRHRIPCVSIPYTSKHFDSRTISRAKISNMLNPVAELQKNQNFSKWISYSEQWRYEWGGYHTLNNGDMNGAGIISCQHSKSNRNIFEE